MGKLRNLFCLHLRARLVVPWATIPVAVLIIFGMPPRVSFRPETVTLDELGFTLLEVDDPVRIVNYPARNHTPAFEISGDGRWLAMRVALDDPTRDYGKDWLFFDLEAGQCVASLKGSTDDREVELLTGSGWSPDDLPVLWIKKYPRPPSGFRNWANGLFGGPPPATPDHAAVCIADIPDFQAHIRFSESRTRKGLDRIALPNPARSGLYLIRVQSHYYPTNETAEFRLYDLRPGRGEHERVMDENTRITAWLDDRTAIKVTEEGIALVDVWSGEVVRDIPIEEPLEQLQKQGDLEPGDVLPFEGQEKLLPGPRLRFLLGICPERVSGEHSHRLSLWDIELDTGALDHVMDLDWCKPYLCSYPRHSSSIVDFVQSADGGYVVAPVSSSTIVTASVGTSLTLAVASSGQPPRVLPIHVPRFYSNNPNAKGRSEPCPISFHMAFADENTLVYRGAGDTLWRFDVRTTEPECIWRPPTGTGNGQADVVGRLVDTRGNPVVDRLVCIVPTDKPQSPDEQLISTKTDRAGRFQFHEVPADTYALEAEAYPGFGLVATQRAKGGSFTLEEGKAVRDLVRITEALEDRGIIAGRVTDAQSGAPIDEFDCLITSVDGVGELPPVLGFGLIRTAFRATTKPIASIAPYDTDFISGRDGAFRIAGISPGTATLEISAPGRGTVRTHIRIDRGQTVAPTYRVAREAVLRGQVTIDGKRPTYGGWAQLWKVGDRSRKIRYILLDAHGVYEFRGLEAGDYQLQTTARAMGQTFIAAFARRLYTHLEPGTTSTLNVEVAGAERDSSIQGSFSASNRHHLWIVSVHDASTTPAGLFPDEGLCGEVMGVENSGRYAIHHLAPGTYDVVGGIYPGQSMNAPKGNPSATTTKTVTLSPGETATVDFDLN